LYSLSASSPSQKLLFQGTDFFAHFPLVWAILPVSGRAFQNSRSQLPASVPRHRESLRTILLPLALPKALRLENTDPALAVDGARRSDALRQGLTD